MTPPRLLNDLYGDLRDRHLLPLVAILLVATGALPFVLGGGGEPVAPPSTDPTSALAAEEIPTLPAVLASAPGLRDYRKRLDSFNSKNPFAAQDFNVPKPAAAAVESMGGDGGGAMVEPTAPSTVSASSDAGSVAIESAMTGAADTSTSATPNSSTAPSSSSASSGSGSGQASSTTSERWFTYRIDVVTGPAGDAEPRKNLKRLMVLPSQSNPVALFLGASEDGNRATFLVSTDVVRTHGDGKCLPSPSDCQILELEPGQERKFSYAPRGEPDTFVIKLEDIRIVEIDRPKGSGSSREAQSARAGLESFLGL